MNLKNQIQKIIAYAQDNNDSITNLEALLYAGVGRLAARISEMRTKGYPIITEWEEKQDESGRYARYVFLAYEPLIE